MEQNKEKLKEIAKDFKEKQKEKDKKLQPEAIARMDSIWTTSVNNAK